MGGGGGCFRLLDTEYLVFPPDMLSRGDASCLRACAGGAWKAPSLAAGWPSLVSCSLSIYHAWVHTTTLSTYGT